MPQIPSTHSRMVNESPVYYGWVILIAGTIGLILTSPGQTYTVSIFIDHMISELQIDRSTISILYGIGTLFASFTLTLFGWLIDKHGPRIMVVVIALIFGLACIFMGFVQNIWMLGIGFFAIRMMGQGSLGIVSQNVINRWWVRRRGSLLGISGLLLAIFGVGAFPNLAHELIDAHGWRTAYMVLGLGLMAIMIPIGWFFFRNKPEDFGLFPDGMVSPPDDDNISDELVEITWTYAEAIRTPVFWVAAAGFMSVGMFATALTFHLVDIFAVKGWSAEIAARAYVPLAAVSAIVTLIGGISVDRLRVKFLVALALAFQAIALWVSLLLTSAQEVILFGITLGATFGLSHLSGGVLWARYFGREHLGQITGTVATITVTGTALGPVLFGVAKDIFGNYEVVLILSGFIPLALGIAILFFGKPHKPNLA